MNLCRFRDNVSLICFQKKLECNHHCLREIVLGVLIISKITTLQSDSEKKSCNKFDPFSVEFLSLCKSCVVPKHHFHSAMQCGSFSSTKKRVDTSICLLTYYYYLAWLTYSCNPLLPAFAFYEEVIP